jgi:hypothetical protein
VSWNSSRIWSENGEHRLEWLTSEPLKNNILICFCIILEGYIPSSPSLGTSNVTPIPLGPSSVRPPVKAPAASKSRPRYQNSRPSDEEEDYFLQRSETGDSRLQQKDLLRYSLLMKE